MKKGERKQASMENVQGLDGWQFLARTVISVVVQESEGAFDNDFKGVPDETP